MIGCDCHRTPRKSRAAIDNGWTGGSHFLEDLKWPTCQSITEQLRKYNKVEKHAAAEFDIYMAAKVIPIVLWLVQWLLALMAACPDTQNDNINHVTAKKGAIKENLLPPSPACMTDYCWPQGQIKESADVFGHHFKQQVIGCSRSTDDKIHLPGITSTRVLLEDVREHNINH